MVEDRIVLARKLFRFRNTKGKWLWRLCPKLSSLRLGGVGPDINVLLLSLFLATAAAAVHSVSPGVHHPVSPSSGRSHSTVLVPVFLGLPRFLFPLGAQVKRATCGFRFGAIRGTCPLPSPASYLFTDLFDPRSSPYFIVGYTYGPMDFQDSFEACVKKGVKPFVMSFCHSPCHASIQQDNNDIWLEDPHLSFSAKFTCSPHLWKSMKNKVLPNLLRMSSSAPPKLLPKAPS